MSIIVDNRLAQDEIDTQIDVLSAELRALKSRRNALSPISQLPQEILRAIYLQVEESDPKKLPPPVILSHVCRSWREMVVSFPGLWADITIRNQTSPSLFDLMLENTRKLPIRLSIKFGLVGHSPIFPAIRNVLSTPERLKALDLDYNINLVNTLIHTRRRADSLEFLRIQSDILLPADILSGGAPNLRHLELEGCIVPWNSPLLLRSPHLTHLILQGPDREAKVSPLQLCRVLKKTPHLQFLDFKLPLANAFNNLNGNLVPTHLPNLHSLKISGGSAELSNLFQMIRIPMSIGVIDTLLLQTEDPVNIDQLLTALKSSLGNPSPDKFISPRQLRFTHYIYEYDDETHTDIETWKEFPTLTTKAQPDLIHFPRGPALNTFTIRTPNIRSINTALLPFLQSQARTAIWTLADLRHLEMNVFEGQSSASAWTLFAQLPKLEEVVVGPESNFEEFLDALSRPIEYASSLPRQQDPSTAVTHYSYSFPALRALVFRSTYCDFTPLHGVLELRQRLGARLEYLKFEDLPVPSPGISQSMSSVATKVVWKTDN